jgi:hypothetical protein
MTIPVSLTIGFAPVGTPISSTFASNPHLEFQLVGAAGVTVGSGITTNANLATVDASGLFWQPTTTATAVPAACLATFTGKLTQSTQVTVLLGGATSLNPGGRTSFQVTAPSGFEFVSPVAVAPLDVTVEFPVIGIGRQINISFTNSLQLQWVPYLIFSFATASEGDWSLTFAQVSGLINCPSVQAIAQVAGSKPLPPFDVLPVYETYAVPAADDSGPAATQLASENPVYVLVDGSTTVKSSSTEDILAFLPPVSANGAVPALASYFTFDTASNVVLTANQPYAYLPALSTTAPQTYTVYFQRVVGSAATSGYADLGVLYHVLNKLTGTSCMLGFYPPVPASAGTRITAPVAPGSYLSVMRGYLLSATYSPIGIHGSVQLKVDDDLDTSTGVYMLPQGAVTGSAPQTSKLHGLLGGVLTSATLVHTMTVHDQEDRVVYEAVTRQSLTLESGTSVTVTPTVVGTKKLPRGVYSISSTIQLEGAPAYALTISGDQPTVVATALGSA